MTDKLPQVYALNTGFGFFMYQIFERFVYGWPVPILSAIMVSTFFKSGLDEDIIHSPNRYFILFKTGILPLPSTW